MSAEKKIYFDNAATTPILPEVIEQILPYMTTHFGNPSSIHAYGRQAKAAVEQARMCLVRGLNCAPGELFFTSGATESTNTVLDKAIRVLGCKKIITSPIEHHATLHTAQYVAQKNGIILEWVRVTDEGEVDYAHLEELLQKSKDKTLVSLLHVHNEIGTINDRMRISRLCRSYDALLHMDAVQTIGHYPLNLGDGSVDFLSLSGHKFHAPKGVGALYVRSGVLSDGLLKGGSQERNMRGGTENVLGIVGMGAAFQYGYDNLTPTVQQIRQLKRQLQSGLQDLYPDIQINGAQEEARALYSLLNISWNRTPETEMLMFKLDMAGICVSSGSACSSGAEKGSHVMAAIGQSDKVSLRFSFSKLNTREEVAYCLDVFKKLL